MKLIENNIDIEIIQDIDPSLCILLQTDYRNESS